ncbi:MAG: chemotaxis protein CheW [Planctomycetes bacterium]|nr:chemotaxis protein CheW [Planctomycetota bacterium]
MSEDTSERQLCTFALDDLYLALPVADVQEVLRAQALTRIPLAPTAVRGLINLRGQIVTALDLRTILGMKAGPPGQAPMNLVLRGEGFSLLVDDIGDVVGVVDAAGEDPPATLREDLRSVCSAVFKLEHRLLVELDASGLIERAFATAAVEGAIA